MDIYGQVPKALESIGNTISNITKDVTSERTRNAMLKLQGIEAERDILKTKADFALQDFRLTNDMKHQKIIEGIQLRELDLKEQVAKVLKDENLPISLEQQIRKVSMVGKTEDEIQAYLKSFTPEQLKTTVKSKDAFKAESDAIESTARIRGYESAEKRDVEKTKREVLEHEQKKLEHKATMGLINLRTKEAQEGGKESAPVKTINKLIELGYDKTAAVNLVLQRKEKSDKDWYRDVYADFVKSAYSADQAKENADKAAKAVGIDVNTLGKIQHGETIKVGKPGSWKNFLGK